jgi:hypothetical protein
MKERRKNNERGSLLASGKLTVQALNSMKDMDFQKLLGYLSNNIDTLWRIPPQRLGSINAGTDKRGANAVFRPYFARIGKEQKLIEDDLNAKFFKYFGADKGDVKIKINRSSGIDQVVDVTWCSMMFHDGAMSLSEYRESMGRSATLPADMEESPFYRTKEEVMAQEQAQLDMVQQKIDSSNKGKLTDNKANPNKTPKQKAEA